MKKLASRFLGYSILIFFALVFLYPFVIQIANSFKTEADASANPLSPIAHPFTAAAFDRIFGGTAFRDLDYGSCAAISFVLFLIIVVLTLLQRRALRERP